MCRITEPNNPDVSIFSSHWDETIQKHNLLVFVFVVGKAEAEMMVGKVVASIFFQRSEIPVIPKTNP